MPVTLVQSQVACFQLFSIFAPSHTQLSKAKLDRHNHLTLSNTCLFQNVDILFNFFIAPHNKDLGVSCVSACVISLTSLRNITGNTVSFRDLVVLLKVQQKIWLVIKNSTYTHTFKTTTEVCVTHGNPGIRCIKMFTCALLWARTITPVVCQKIMYINIDTLQNSTTRWRSSTS